MCVCVYVCMCVCVCARGGGPHVAKAYNEKGKDGRYLVLVVGPFANLSDDFMVLCDFLRRARALA